VGLGALKFSESKNHYFQFWRKKSKWENRGLWVFQWHQRTSSFRERTSKKNWLLERQVFEFFKKTWKLRFYTETNFLNFSPSLDTWVYRWVILIPGQHWVFFSLADMTQNQDHCEGPTNASKQMFNIELIPSYRKIRNPLKRMLNT
jgi:hypothetical protein